jgi:hypothetical protein
MAVSEKYNENLYKCVIEADDLASLFNVRNELAGWLKAAGAIVM